MSPWGGHLCRVRWGRVRGGVKELWDWPEGSKVHPAQARKVPEDRHSPLFCSMHLNFQKQCRGIRLARDNSDSMPPP